MTSFHPIRVVAGAVVLAGVTALPAWGQTGPRVELGAPLVNVSMQFVKDQDTITTLGVGSTFTFLGMSPGVFASFFVGSRLGVGPHVGLILVSSGNDSDHLLNVGGQVDFFLKPISQRSVYLLGAVGVLDMSDEDTTPKLLSAGVGYRVPIGDTLAVRVDGRFTRVILKDEGSNAVTFTVSLGGLFGR